LLLLATTLVPGGSFCRAAQNNNKTKTTTEAPAKPAPVPPAKPASQPGKPGGKPDPGTGATAPSTGPTTSGGQRDTTTGGRGSRIDPTTSGQHGHRTDGQPGSNNQALKRTVDKRPNGDVIERRKDGHVSDVHIAKLGMDVHHGLTGGRRVIAERPGGVRIVAERGRPGFVQQPFAFHGHDFAHRTFFYHGRVYDRFYRGYAYHGLTINVYAPYRYYGVGFYGWAYNPWFRPVAYAWGWGPSPWYGYYGYYFAPYPAYPSASLWLTDYMISSDLQAEYQANLEASTIPPPQASDGAPGLSPDVKQMVSQEVANQIALENSEAQQNAQGQDPDPGSSGIARIMADRRPHVFVAGSNLDVVNASGAECAISAGDALQFNPPADPSAPAASLVVLASKGGAECAKSDTVTIALNDLQEMQNHMRQTIDDGLAKLQAQQGQGGLPQAPPSAQGAPVNAGFAAIAPPPDPNAAAEISQQDAQANTAEIK
jgi:hypothetical protein